MLWVGELRIGREGLRRSTVDWCNRLPSRGPDGIPRLRAARLAVKVLLSPAVTRYLTEFELFPASSLQTRRASQQIRYESSLVSWAGTMAAELCVSSQLRGRGPRIVPLRISHMRTPATI